jgi:hypothetical protein
LHVAAVIRIDEENLPAPEQRRSFLRDALLGVWREEALAEELLSLRQKHTVRLAPGVGAAEPAPAKGAP